MRLCSFSCSSAGSVENVWASASQRRFWPSLKTAQRSARGYSANFWGVERVSHPGPDAISVNASEGWGPDAAPSRSFVAGLGGEEGSSVPGASRTYCETFTLATAIAPKSTKASTMAGILVGTAVFSVCMQAGRGVWGWVSYAPQQSLKIA